MCVKSILDTDVYKFSTSWAYMKLYPEAEGTFEFCDRDNTQYDQKFLEMIKEEFENLSKLFLSESEFTKVSNRIKYIPKCYWEWLKGFRFDYRKIKCKLDSDNHLHIQVTDLLYKVTLYEVPILAIVSEIRNKWLGYNYSSFRVFEKIFSKIQTANLYQLKFSEFGTRRRFSYEVQEYICKLLKKHSTSCTGTSNVYLGLKYDMRIIGTHPHEWFMFHGAIFGYKQANYLSLEDWIKVYDGNLGIALTDTYTSDVFFKNFSLKHAKLFDGIRHDSGDPYKFIDKAITKYTKYGIDPTTKTIVFSNGLNFDEYKKIHDYCQGKIRCAAGIGTNLTNDCGFKPSNIVMKLVSCKLNKESEVEQCIKLSDDEGKHMGNSKEIDICKHECHIRTYEDFAKFLGTKPKKLGCVPLMCPTLYEKFTEEKLDAFIDSYFKTYAENK